MKKTFSKNELPKIAQEILGSLKQNQSATTVALSGDLGAGKTSLTQAIADELGISENVISPTFLIVKKYKTKKGLHAHLIHIDAYRLDSSEELLKLGWEEMLSDKNNLVIVEWPEKVSKIIPQNALRVSLLHEDKDLRSIIIS